MPRYLLLTQHEGEPPAPTPAEQASILASYREVYDLLDRKGCLVDASELHPSAMTTTVRSSERGLVVTDGPFAETTEHLGGFFLVDLPDLDEAIAIAGRLPAARTGAVEIRPVVETG